MKVTIFAGKGGVGKSTSSASYALHSSDQKRLGIIDYDGGHSIARIIGLPSNFPVNELSSTNIGVNLDFGIVGKLPYMRIAEAKLHHMPITRYLAQFSEDYGLIPFNDMITEFFGAVTDVDGLVSFITLTRMLTDASVSDRDVVIDVEPTAGLERLLGSTKAVTRSMKNLRDLGAIKKTVLGTAWPDIRAFLDGPYIANAEKYSDRLSVAAETLRTARYNLVCVPEPGPVAQLAEVSEILARAGASVKGYVVNNVRGIESEKTPLATVNHLARGLPIVHINHDSRINSPDFEIRRAALKENGAIISKHLD
ncbi:MAG: ArsA-related P-loop ATPase [Candidatus Pacearchaeota archaeon]